MPPPKTGLHRWAKHSRQYKDIHRFLSSRRWAPIKEESATAGTTWIELFALYDTCGQRDVKSEHIKDEKAKERAKERSNKRARASEGKGKKGQGYQGDAVIRPTLREELKRFKDIVKQITNHEIEQEKKNGLEWKRDKGCDGWLT